MKIAPARWPTSIFPSFLRPSSEIKIETKPKAKEKIYGTQNAESAGDNFWSPSQAAEIAPVIAEKFERDCMVRKSLTMDFGSISLEPSSGACLLVEVFNKFVAIYDSVSVV